MTPVSLASIVIYLIILLLLVKPLGSYIANVMEGRPIWPLRAGARFDRFVYRVSGIDPSAQMGWKRYMLALLVFNTVGALAVYALQRAQLCLPLNPQAFASVSPHSSLNTAISFVTWRSRQSK